MVCPLRTVRPIPAYSEKSKENQKRLQNFFEKTRKISSTHISKSYRSQRPNHDDIEPITLCQRVVFRSEGQLPVKRLLQIHKVIKSESNVASKVLSVFSLEETTKNSNAISHSIIRHVYEE